MKKEWKIFIKYKNESYRALKIKQGNSLDITIVAKNALYLSRTVSSDLKDGEEIKVAYDDIGKYTVDHYSAHSESGQRHVKIHQEPFAHEKCVGVSFKNITKIIPLVTMVTAVNESSKEEVSGNWFGFSLPDDVNYLILDIFAMPLDAQVDFKLEFKINNIRKTAENFDYKILEMINCNILLIVRSTNNQLTDIPNSILFQQVKGKTINIVRVENGYVLAQASTIKTVEIC